MEVHTAVKFSLKHLPSIKNIAMVKDWIGKSHILSFATSIFDKNILLFDASFAVAFLFKWMFRSHPGEHHQNSNAFFVRKNENETCKKHTGNQE